MSTWGGRDTAREKWHHHAAISAVMSNPEPAKPPKPTGPEWPRPLAPEALYGLAGDIVRAIEPHTESDNAALLVQLLVACGNAIGRAPYFRAGSDLHHMNLFAVLVGASSKGRKGSSQSNVKEILRGADPEWAAQCTQSGLSSGEGLLWAVRDQIECEEAIRDSKTKRVTDYQTVVTDRGVEDKRLLVLESEFASTLRVAGRDGNTLSASIRQAWDDGMLRVMTKNTPAKATGAHISVIGHITQDELLRYLTSTEAGNGFANRFLWVCVKRSKLLPDGGNLHSVDLQSLIRRVSDALATARSIGELRRDADARDMWHDVYPHLSADRFGLFGAVTTRAEAIALRLSCLYALLDRSDTVRVEHLAAALEVWRYCEDSARFIFRDSLGDQTADTILKALRCNPTGLTRTEVSSLFERNKQADQIARALDLLRSRGLARSVSEATSGRPTERWFIA